MPAAHTRPAVLPAAPFSPSQALWILSGASWVWGRVAPDSPAGQIHRTIQRYRWDSYGVVGRLIAAAAFLAGAPVVMVMIVRNTRKRGHSVMQHTGKSRLRQVREQLELWLTKAVLPISYYVFELYDDALRTRALEYLFRYETKCGAYPLFRECYSSVETTEALRSKAEFAKRCEQYDLAVIPALLTVDHSVLRRLDGSGAGLPRCDLFLKPLSGSGGRGASVWRYSSDDDSYSNTRVGSKTEAELLEYLRELSETRAHIARPLVTNHAAIADMSPGALSSVRVVTCLNEAGSPEATHAVLRMARTADSVVDNFHAGGIAARVDLETGELGAATDLGLNAHTRWHNHHPLTGAAIRGRVIPFWQQILELAERAHAAFSDHIVVGWDIAITPEGPALIEGNKSPDLDIVQRTGRAPAGNSRLGVLLAYHLRRALEDDTAITTLPPRVTKTPRLRGVEAHP